VRRYRRINVHRIALDDTFKELSAGSKLDSDFDFFEMLKKGGAQAAKKFLDAHFGDLGKCAARWIWAPRQKPSGRDFSGVPGAMQHEVMHCRPGIAKSTAIECCVAIRPAACGAPE
jgi:hypothetical protein